MTQIDLFVTSVENRPKKRRLERKDPFDRTGQLFRISNDRRNVAYPDLFEALSIELEKQVSEVIDLDAYQPAIEDSNHLVMAGKANTLNEEQSVSPDSDVTDVLKGTILRYFEPIVWFIVAISSFVSLLSAGPGFSFPLTSISLFVGSIALAIVSWRRCSRTAV